MSDTTTANIQEPVEKSSDKKKKKPSSWSIILKHFRELKLPLPSAPETWLDFSALGELLYEPKVIVVTTKILNTALKQKDDNSRHRARVFLTSYVMLMCPNEILSLENEDEKKLYDSAQRMLHLFETWLSAHGHPGATAARLGFVEVWNEYMTLFELWKSKDRNQFVDNLIAYYVQLSTLRQNMIADNDPSVGDELQQQLDRVKLRLEQLGGSVALESLQRALEKSAASTSTGRRRQQEKVKPRVPEVEERDEMTKEQDEINKEQMNQLLNQYSSSFFTNLQLAHELILDPQFSLENHVAESALERQVKEVAEKALFDQIVEEIERGEMAGCVPGLIHDIKQRFLSLISPKSHLYQRIEHEIDLDLIKQEIKQNTFDMNQMIRYLTDMMATLCAPVRDSEIQAIRQQVDKPVEQLKGIFHLLDNMSLDMANFRLRTLRRSLMPIAVDYEREKFAEMLSSGMIQLVRTKRWLTASGERCPNARGHDAIFAEAFVSLLQHPKVLTADELPETLLLDAKRITSFQNEFQANTIVAALLMLARNFGTISAQKQSELATKLFAILEDQSTWIDHLTVEIERAIQFTRSFPVVLPR
ncbi:hypothetical protein RO3G_14050 [Rhizopus delemar RA 99-880]|uniref:T-complex protein 11 n=1 Tax=Rhizopus delemar (strain RA 99-880 / ATCC MYA-4621 / FGSC 9543 / NRRL 43880) TaxID=246409 RepID=I1CLK9_RHIO9|nr:hypothetical protein RO3G_14050 [Rhizopus delemar RA 99-880]|eukprot:EIE89339.1 hypothetical protein RO3G_14050 [Rhizopus delemar RA 99-880]